MTNQNHPITSPPELVEEWATMLEYHPDEKVFSEVAQWGADQELEACCAEVSWNGNKVLAAELRTRRRPKPPSLKEQALAALESAPSPSFPNLMRMLTPDQHDLIRRALEELPND